MKGDSVMTTRQVIFHSVVMALVMSAVMCMAMILVNVGWDAKVFAVFVRRWYIAFLVALPFSFSLPPLIRRVMRRWKI